MFYVVVLGLNVLNNNFSVNLSDYSVIGRLLNSYHARGDFCHLFIIFANSFAPDQGGQNVGPDLDPNCLPL